MNQRITKVRKKLQNGFSEAIPIGAKAENITLQNGTVLQDVIEELQTGRAGHADLTQAEYNALPESKKNDGTVYFVADGANGTNNAAAVRYNNNASGLSATNVQAVIDEINTNVEAQVAALKAVDATLKDAATKTVANNLVTTSQGYVLDARQGKALQDEVAALNSSLTPKSYTGYSFSAYSATDTGLSYVYIIGKICIFSLAFIYASDYTPAATQIFVNGMPKPAHDSYLQGMSFNGRSMEPFRCRVYANGNTGSISNYYSGMKTYANVPSIITGAYVIA